MGYLVPITFFAGLFAWLVYRRHCLTQQKVQLAAIERGLLNLPAPAPNDHRKIAWVLIALGLGFAIAIHVSLSLVPDTELETPLAVSVWGIIPILVGGALWLYHLQVSRETTRNVPAGIAG
ncbi:MAG: hypothetical protein WDA75_04610 [Candidatus Latescibacterota bacterium]|jgi:hypothetical protein